MSEDIRVPSRLGLFLRSLKAVLGARWDAAGDLGTDIAALIAAIGSAPVATAATNGAADYFTPGAPGTSVVVVNTNQAYVGGVDVDVNGFTNGANLTFTVRKKLGNGLNLRQYTFTVQKTAIVTWVPIIGAEELFQANANTLIVYLQSDNAADVAVAVPYNYFVRLT